MSLSRLSPHRGSKEKRTRVGRGPGSGSGKTAGRGQKGQTSRSGSGKRPGFEGGQMPLLRRIPKRGFFSPGRERLTTAVVNVGDLGQIPAGTEVTMEFLRARGFVKGAVDRVKILGEGMMSAALKISAHAFSQSAREKIEKAGGTVTVLS